MYPLSLSSNMIYSVIYEVFFLPVERPEKYRMSSSSSQEKVLEVSDVLTLTLHPNVLVVAAVRLTLEGVPA